MHLFGGVDEQKEEREGARRDRTPLQRECIDLVEKCVKRWGARLAVAPCATRLAQRFDRRERHFALDPANDPAE